MAQPLDEALARIRAGLLDDKRLVRAVAAGRRRGAAPSWRRAELRYVDLRAGRRLQVTRYDDRQAHTGNERLGADAERAVDALLAEPFGNWHLDTTDETVQLRVTKRGDALVHARGREAAAEPSRAHDRSKRRLLDADDPMLHLIGISDHRGRVKPSRQAKYRQVEEFIRALDTTLDDALAAGALVEARAGDAVPAEGGDRPLHVVDLGCGNAYLTFAAFGYLDGRRGLPVRMLGVDVRASSRTRNTELAEQLGWSDRLRFVEAGIADVRVDRKPDVVLALHSCDTATDEALARALEWSAPVVLAAPCCHHDLQTQLRQAATPEPFGPLTQHGILRERFADVLTDTFRAAILRRYGYRVDVVEFVGSRHTPRNVLLRAVRTGAAPSARAQHDYEALRTQWGVQPALERMLEDR